MATKDFPFLEIKENLINCIIPFWKKMKDDEFGGFYEYLDSDLCLFKKADKSAVQTCRILWFFVNAYEYTKDKECAECAKHAYNFLINHLLDKQNGGVFWTATYDGNAQETSKTSFALSYAILALTSFARLTFFEEAKKAKELAFTLQNLLEEKFFTKKGYNEVLKHDFSSFDQNLVFFSKGPYGGVKTTNTLLHITEAYFELYKTFKTDFTKEKLYSLLSFIYEHCYDNQNNKLKIFFDNDFNPSNDYISFGHEAELSFLLRKVCRYLEKDNQSSNNESKNLYDTIEIMCSSLCQDVWKNAYSDSCVVDEVYDEKVKNRRIYWVQSEAVLAFFMQSIIKNDKTYLEASISIWNFIKTNLIDKKPNSEWLYMVSKNEEKSSRPIVFSWKAPYNNARMCFEVLKYLNQ